MIFDKPLCNDGVTIGDWLKALAEWETEDVEQYQASNSIVSAIPTGVAAQTPAPDKGLAERAGQAEDELPETVLAASGLDAAVLVALATNK